MTQDLLLFAVGILVGAMNAVAGGGILIGFPVLLASGLSPIVANASSYVIVLPGLIASVFGYRKHLHTVPKKYMWLLVPCAIGAAIGSAILKHTTSNKFEELVPLLVFFAVVLFAIQPLLHFHLHKHLKTKSKRIKPLVWIGIALLPVSVYGGYFGAGFGFIMLAFLGFTKLKDVHKMNAVKNLSAIVICTVSIASLFSTGLINWHYALMMGTGCAVGGYYSSILTQRFTTHAIRVTVIILGITTASYMAFQAL